MKNLLLLSLFFLCGLARAHNPVDIERYRDEELRHNELYVSKLQGVIENSFERQLGKFEDEELGFVAGYANMFSYIFSSKREWNERLSIRAQRYFSTLEIKKELNQVHEEYTNNLTLLRQQIQSKLSQNHAPIPSNLFEIPKQDISLKSMGEHTRNNLIIEAADWLFDWLLAIFIGWLLVTVLGLCVKSCVINIIAIVLGLGISIFVSIKNDNKLLAALREQKPVLTYDYNEYLVELNQKINAFYESL